MWLALLWSAVALAHAHLTGSSPADGSHVADAPTTLVLSFSEAAQLTAPAAAQARIRVPLPALAAGDYVVSWRALGADGHLVPGQIRFTIAPR